MQKKTLNNEMNNTWWVSTLFEMFVEELESLRSKRSSPLSFFWRLEADELWQILHSVLVSLFGHLHPPFQDRLDFLCTLRSYVQLLEPSNSIDFIKTTMNAKQNTVSLKKRIINKDITRIFHSENSKILI